MSLKSPGLEPIPEETRRLVKRLCPKGTTVTQLRDALGPIYPTGCATRLKGENVAPTLQD